MDKRKVMGWFVIIVMVAGGMGVVLTGDGSVQTYNGYKFTQTAQGWQTKVNGQNTVFNFYPGNIAFTGLPPEAASFKDKKVLTVSYNPDVDLTPAFAQLQYDFELKLPDSVFIIRAVTNGSSLPLFTCANATSSSPVVVFDQAENATSTYIDNCLTITGFDAYGFATQAEALLYTMLGVIE
ncbi:MAG: hypothetical protein QF486_02245 [Candidatus Woesearchaeota archaeon]|jgi:hypothetical protein|nr:hypothetical protein [Candidatus Woesearchaeota archaeon]MDP7180965.1 hypothetical protein [Candidatus Woesearchaeota archaeon]MDP7198414.1 hypothetical protein [Candidatus Woesearchaeota archaeon]MDP7467515.1 hypothetical protein [Candidatus Woesearchaeota archaeon]MDP7646568.1 hypothetical protein [Candidatus Woesearchaeota archaeon]|tara:strand:- start:157 stop:699 length:543 start_codon:yes stop_codon:yes gene_type:complete